MDKFKYIIISFFIFVFGAGFVVGKRLVPEPTISSADTTYIRDTTIIEPEYKEPKTDSIRVEIYKDRIIHDTINKYCYVNMPRERKYFRGANYSCEVSGIDPRLERLEIYNTSSIINNKIVPAVNKHSINTSLEVLYIIRLELPITLEYDYSINKFLSLQASISYELLNKQFGCGVGISARVCGW